jgi:hypothetical protein
MSIYFDIEKVILIMRIESKVNAIVGMIISFFETEKSQPFDSRDQRANREASR